MYMYRNKLNIVIINANFSPMNVCGVIAQFIVAFKIWNVE